MNEQVVCIATLVAKEEQSNQLYIALKELISPTRNEKGCLGYELHQDISSPEIFTMIEKYVNQEAFEFHSNQIYLKKFKKNIENLAKSVKVNLYKIIV